MSGNLTVNTSHGDVIAILKQSIAERKPLALCRFGDGEFCFINHRSTPSILKQFCKNWGFQYPKEISVARNMFLPILVRGLCGADLIGILDPKCRVLKGHSYKPTVDQLNMTQRIDFDFLREANVPCFGSLERGIRFLFEYQNRTGFVYPAPAVTG